MAQTLTQRMMELGVPFVMANELVKQMNAGVYNVTRLINSGWVEDLARYLATSLPAGTFKATKAVEYSMVPAIAVLVAGGGVVPSPVGFYMNGASNTTLKAAIARVKDGTGRGTIVFKGDSTESGEGAGTLVNSTYVGGARPKRPSSVLASLLSAAGSPTIDQSLVGDNGMSFNNAVTLQTYDARAANFKLGNGTAAAWGQVLNQQLAGGAVLNVATATSSFTPDIPVDTFEIVYFNLDAYNLNLRIDGANPAAGPAQVAVVNSNSGFSKATVTAASVGLHTLSFFGSKNGFGGIRSIKAYNSTIKALDILNHASRAATSADQATSVTAWGNNDSLGYDAPDLTVIKLGTNDMNANVSVATFTANLQAIVTKAKLSGDVLLVFPFAGGTYGGPGFSNNIVNMEAGAKTLAVSNGVSFLSLYEHYGPFPNLQSRFADGVVHPNEGLYAEIAGLYKRCFDLMVA